MTKSKFQKGPVGMLHLQPSKNDLSKHREPLDRASAVGPEVRADFQDLGFQATDAEPLALSYGALTYPILASHLDFKQNDLSLVPHESYKHLGMGGESAGAPDRKGIAIPTSFQPLLLTQGAH